MKAMKCLSHFLSSVVEYTCQMPLQKQKAFLTTYLQHEHGNKLFIRM